MSAVTSVTIAKQPLAFSSADGRVETAQLFTETTVWSEGGGGYVDPSYGGVVYPPEIYSKCDRLVRTRLAFDGGQKATMVLPGNVDVSPGDLVTLIYAEKPGSGRQVLAAAINHDTGNSFVLASPYDLKLYRPTLLQRLGILLTAFLTWGAPGLFAVGIVGFGIYVALLVVMLPILTGPMRGTPGTADVLFPPAIPAVAIVAAALSGYAKSTNRLTLEFRDAVQRAVELEWARERPVRPQSATKQIAPADSGHESTASISGH